MEKIAAAQKKDYGISCTDMREAERGLSARTYRITAGEKVFFLKQYDKRCIQTSCWIHMAETCLPLLLWLCECTPLKGRISSPVRTLTGEYRAEDPAYFYVLSDYIDGSAIGFRPLTRAQTAEAADLIACLHASSQAPPLPAGRIKERFRLPFCGRLNEWLTDRYADLPQEAKDILSPCRERLTTDINRLQRLAGTLARTPVKRMLCHTDAHGGNLMQSDRLILTDWESMKYAPAEADLFLFAAKPHWELFMQCYRARRPGFVCDGTLMAFYTLRRKLEDIAVFLDRVLLDTHDPSQRQNALFHLAWECSNPDTFFF